MFRFYPTGTVTVLSNFELIYESEWYIAVIPKGLEFPCQEVEGIKPNCFYQLLLVPMHYINYRSVYLNISFTHIFSYLDSNNITTYLVNLIITSTMKFVCYISIHFH